MPIVPQTQIYAVQDRFVQP